MAGVAALPPRLQIEGYLHWLHNRAFISTWTRVTVCVVVYNCVCDASRSQRVVLSQESVFNLIAGLVITWLFPVSLGSVGGHAVTSWSGLDGLPHSPRQPVWVSLTCGKSFWCLGFPPLPHRQTSLRSRSGNASVLNERHRERG